MKFKSRFEHKPFVKKLAKDLKRSDKVQKQALTIEQMAKVISKPAFTYFDSDFLVETPKLTEPAPPVTPPPTPPAA